ncbi:MAG: hypothetical protein CMJ24_03735 [Phycisphaerae bacterium]|nr:hypothetical protein [Phycisphaerae bacterium]|tara:strand:- start:293 stop:2875 length:2583 start_codon:yes stop_codon:yes gene_type:complete
MMLCAVASFCTTVRGDDVASFLETRDFDRLLAIHLEQEMEGLSGEARADAAQRLARLYASLLMQAVDRGDRAYLETRGLQLLKGIPSGEADDLRVELINGRYLVAEDVAERHRLRLDDLGETQQAIETLDDLIEQLERIRLRTERDLKGTSRSIERGTPFRSTSRRERLAKQEQLLRRTRYLLGWATYYRAWLSGDAMMAEQAQAIFAELLELQPGDIKPEFVSRDLRSEDVIAWSILGMAASRGITHSSVSTMQWFDLLEEANVPETIRTMLPAWRLAVLLDNGDYTGSSASVSQIIDRLERSGTLVPTTWWRLIAVHALEADDDFAMELADRAIAELAARNALNHLYDLVERYGEILSDRDGFALAYARGVLLFQEAKSRSDADGLPQTEAARVAYQDAQRQLTLALQQSDRERWGSAQVACSSLLAWSLYLQGHHADARDQFLQLLDREEDRDRYEESLWMAIVSQDHLVRLTDRAEAVQELEGLVDRYLETFPDGARSGELTVRRSARSEASLEAVERLLAVTEDDPVWIQAQQGASRMLYRLFSREKGSQRIESGSRYLTISVPLLMLDVERAPDDQAAAGRALARSRRILEVALDDDLQRLVAADSVLSTMQVMDSFPIEPPDGYMEEIAYRAVQLNLSRKSIDAATQLVGSLIESDPGGLWTRLAVRAIFRATRDRWIESGPDADRRADAARLIYYGNLLLQEAASIPEALEAPGMVAVASIVAKAGLESWLSSRDDQMAVDSWRLYGELLAAHPRNQEFLRGRGLLSPSQGDLDEAMRCWRILMVGTSSGSVPWFEARTNLIELLSEADPARADDVLRQHRVLFPDWGPEPWGERLRDVSKRLSESPDREAP